MHKPDIVSDLKASIVVFLVALPLCLGIALASNAPLSAGLLAGVIGGIIVGAVSGSAIGVSGPAAGLTVIVINGIAQTGSFQTFTMAVLLAGIFQIIFGILKGGAIGDYFPTAVIRGMLAAIGLILILKQYPNALGLQKGWSFSTFFESLHLGVVFISVVSISLMLWWDKMATKEIKFFKLIPGALVAVLVSILMNILYASINPSLVLTAEFLVQIPFTGALSEIFAGVGMPNFSALMNKDVIQVGMTIAIVASLETLLCVNASDKLDPLKRTTSKDRELFAQGIGNVISGFFGGLPLTQVIVRTTANVAAGASSKFSTIFHGIWLLTCVALIPGLLNLIPLGTLACVLLLTGYKLCKPAHFKDMKKRGWDQLFIFSATIMAIIATDLLIGIFIGIGVAILFELRKTALRPFTISHESEASVLEFTNNVSFFHKGSIAKALNSVPQGKTLHIKGMKFVRVHVDVHEQLAELKGNLEKKSVTIIIHS